jgi:hypothetical protein
VVSFVLWFYCAFLAQISLHLIPNAQSSDQPAFLQPSHRTVLHHRPVISGSHLLPFAKFDEVAACLKTINVSMKDSMVSHSGKPQSVFIYIYVSYNDCLEEEATSYKMQ